jgi:hypothetical protein
MIENPNLLKYLKQDINVEISNIHVNGVISRKTHEAISIAMNIIGEKSNPR